MNTIIKLGADQVDWDAVCAVLESSGLGVRDSDRVKRASENSYLVCTAYAGADLIGFGRALSDGEYQSAIYDVSVLPGYQGKGVGKGIMAALLERLPGGVVLIYVVPGKEGFYKRLGFWPIRGGMARFNNPESAREKGHIV